MPMIRMLNEFDGNSMIMIKIIGKKSKRYSIFRAHLNDLENILPYLFVGLFYVLTSPLVSTATLLFKVAAIARIVHTIVYAVIVVPQPARGTAWVIHYAITLYMAVSVIQYSK